MSQFSHVLYINKQLGRAARRELPACLSVGDVRPNDNVCVVYIDPTSSFWSSFRSTTLPVCSELNTDIPAALDGRARVIDLEERTKKVKFLDYKYNTADCITFSINDRVAVLDALEPTLGLPRPLSLLVEDGLAFGSLCDFSPHTDPSAPRPPRYEDVWNPSYAVLVAFHAISSALRVMANTKKIAMLPAFAPALMWNYFLYLHTETMKVLLQPEGSNSISFAVTKPDGNALEDIMTFFSWALHVWRFGSPTEVKRLIACPIDASIDADARRHTIGGMITQFNTHHLINQLLSPTESLITFQRYTLRSKWLPTTRRPFLDVLVDTILADNRHVFHGQYETFVRKDGQLIKKCVPEGEPTAIFMLDGCAGNDALMLDYSRRLLIQSTEKDSRSEALHGVQFYQGSDGLLVIGNKYTVMSMFTQFNIMCQYQTRGASAETCMQPITLVPSSLLVARDYLSLAYAGAVAAEQKQTPKHRWNTFSPALSIVTLMRALTGSHSNPTVAPTRCHFLVGVAIGIVKAIRFLLITRPPEANDERAWFDADELMALCKSCHKWLPMLLSAFKILIVKPEQSNVPASDLWAMLFDLCDTHGINTGNVTKRITDIMCRDNSKENHDRLLTDFTRTDLIPELLWQICDTLPSQCNNEASKTSPAVRYAFRLRVFYPFLTCYIGTPEKPPHPNAQVSNATTKALHVSLTTSQSEHAASSLKTDFEASQHDMQDHVILSTIMINSELIANGAPIESVATVPWTSSHPSVPYKLPNGIFQTSAAGNADPSVIAIAHEVGSSPIHPQLARCLAGSHMHKMYDDLSLDKHEGDRANIRRNVTTRVIDAICRREEKELTVADAYSSSHANPYNYADSPTYNPRSPPDQSEERATDLTTSSSASSTAAFHSSSSSSSSLPSSHSSDSSSSSSHSPAISSACSSSAGLISHEQNSSSAYASLTSSSSTETHSQSTHSPASGLAGTLVALGLLSTAKAESSAPPAQAPQSVAPSNAETTTTQTFQWCADCKTNLHSRQNCPNNSYDPLAPAADDIPSKRDLAQRERALHTQAVSVASHNLETRVRNIANSPQQVALRAQQLEQTRRPPPPPPQYPQHTHEPAERFSSTNNGWGRRRDDFPRDRQADRPHNFFIDRVDPYRPYDDAARREQMDWAPGRGRGNHWRGGGRGRGSGWYDQRRNDTRTSDWRDARDFRDVRDPHPADRRRDDRDRWPREEWRERRSRSRSWSRRRSRSRSRRREFSRSRSREFRKPDPPLVPVYSSSSSLSSSSSSSCSSSPPSSSPAVSSPATLTLSQPASHVNPPLPQAEVREEPLPDGTISHASEEKGGCNICMSGSCTNHFFFEDDEERTQAIERRAADIKRQKQAKLNEQAEVERQRAEKERATKLAREEKKRPTTTQTQKTRNNPPPPAKQARQTDAGPQTRKPIPRKASAADSKPSTVDDRRKASTKRKVEQGGRGDSDSSGEDEGESDDEDDKIKMITQLLIGVIKGSKRPKKKQKKKTEVGDEDKKKKKGRK